jgi:hypothetical protein
MSSPVELLASPRLISSGSGIDITWVKFAVLKEAKEFE